MSRFEIFLETINEEWITTTPAGTRVYKNPSGKDYHEIKSKWIRFILDCEKKEIYVWNAHSEIHAGVFRHLFSVGDLFGDQIRGEGLLKNLKLSSVDFQSFKQAWFLNNKKFISRYFDYKEIEKRFI